MATKAQSDSLAVLICRVSVAFVWFYHGLVPKLLGPHVDETAMNLALGVSENTAWTVSMAAGVIELLIAACVLIFYRARWPLLITLAAMPTLLIYTTLFIPQLNLAAFNPVTTNVSAFALAWVALILQNNRRHTTL